MTRSSVPSATITLRKNPWFIHIAVCFKYLLTLMRLERRSRARIKILIWQANGLTETQPLIEKTSRLTARRFFFTLRFCFLFCVDSFLAFSFIVFSLGVQSDWLGRARASWSLPYRCTGMPPSQKKVFKTPVTDIRGPILSAKMSKRSVCAPPLRTPNFFLWFAVELSSTSQKSTSRRVSPFQVPLTFRSAAWWHRWS